MFFELNYIFLFSNSFISNLSMYWAMLKVMRIVHKGVMHEDNIIWQCKSLIKFSGDYNYIKFRVFHTIFHICIVFEFKVCDHILGFWFLKLNIFYFELFMKFMSWSLIIYSFRSECLHQFWICSRNYMLFYLFSYRSWSLTTYFELYFEWMSVSVLDIIVTMLSFIRFRFINLLSHGSLRIILWCKLKLQPKIRYLSFINFSFVAKSLICNCNAIVQSFNA